SIIVQITDNDRHGLFLSQLTGSVSSVPGHQLIAAIRVRASNRRDQHPVRPHTVGGLHHSLVILDLTRVVLERVQLRERNFYYSFPLGIGSTFLGGKQIIYRSQLYFFRAAFQVSSPPGSDSCNLLPLCLWVHGQ